MQIYAKMDIGKVRAVNQDAFFTKELGGGTVFAAVCDGMGGANAGNVASGKAISVISEYVERSFRPGMTADDAAKMLKRAIESANMEIYDMACKDAQLTGMGTTAVTAIVCDDYAVVVHVGDSRAYLVGDKLKQLTRDHSVVQSLIESGKLTKDQAKVDPRKNVITRALGVEADVLSDCCEFFISEGESLLLCTDGLTNFIEPEEIAKQFRENDISAVPQNLINLANHNGGGDNITVVVITNRAVG